MTALIVLFAALGIIMMVLGCMRQSFALLALASTSSMVAFVLVIVKVGLDITAMP